jgi:hypothetical protein
MKLPHLNEVTSEGEARSMCSFLNESVFHGIQQTLSHAVTTKLVHETGSHKAHTHQHNSPTIHHDRNFL